ncbi:hypothetical protein J6590_053390 [Homalodisca vitripennis]|nr:hypothetical protein J6590_053390 [Homalodisca vitripennis]
MELVHCRKSLSSRHHAAVWFSSAAQPLPEVVENSNYYKTKNLFEDYLTPDVLDCDIVICTVLTSMNITRLQFGYLYIDGSGQLSEPDLVIANTRHKDVPPLPAFTEETGSELAFPSSEEAASTPKLTHPEYPVTLEAAQRSL